MKEERAEFCADALIQENKVQSVALFAEMKIEDK